jgi:hypothetical protein
MCASSFHSKKDGLAGLLPTTQLDLFDYRVSDRTAAARLFHAPKARCMMLKRKKAQPTYPQRWREYNLSQTNEKA